MPSWARNVFLTTPVRPLIMLIGGQGVAAMAGLVYGKLTAIYISPTVWGDYSLLLVAMTLVYSLFITPTLQAGKAALAQFSRHHVITFYSRLLAGIYLGLGIAALVVCTYYQTPLCGLIWLVAVGQGIVQFGSNYLNAFGQHRRYTFLQASYSIGTLVGFASVVVALNQRTVTGLWQAMLFVNGLWAILTGWQLRRNVNESVSLVSVANVAELRTAYKHYVWPLLSLTFWTWLINYADRYLVRLYLTEADVGQYSMGYSLGSKLLMAVAPLLTFLSPQLLRLRSTGQSPDAANQLINAYLVRYVVLAGAGCLVFYLCQDWIGQLLLSDRYAAAFRVGPVVATGYLFLTSIHLLELKWYVFGQTKFVLWHNVLGAVLNIGFNLLLIPRMGISGSAFATLLGFIGQFLLAYCLFTSVKTTDL